MLPHARSIERRWYCCVQAQEVEVPESPAGEPRLSVVIPMFNETTRMRKSLPQLLDYLAAQPYAYEVVVVDAGSADETPALAREMLAGVAQHRVIETRPNRGKGHALRVGMTASRGQYVLFTDADLSTPPTELDKFWPWLEQGID